VIDVAFIAAASAFSSSGGTARWLLAITHHAGFVLHAAVVIVAPKQLLLWDPVSPSTAASPYLADPGAGYRADANSSSRTPPDAHPLRCGIEKCANQRHRLCGAFLHQPMS
jgi:hypothetical protein